LDLADLAIEPISQILKLRKVQKIVTQKLKQLDGESLDSRNFRTRDALRALKERGAVLGKPENLTLEARDKGTVARISNARTNENNRKAAAMIRSLREQGATFQAIADQLNQLGFPTRRGCRFFPTQVRRLWQRRAVESE
jgi:hypothetical protein